MRRTAHLTGALVLGALLASGGLALAAPAVGAAGGHHPAEVRAVHSSAYGTILVSATGRTLYGLTADRPGKSKCAASCASVWPPLMAHGSLSAGSGVKRSCLRSFARGSGHQVEYCGIPLYTFSGDTSKGQVHGFGIKSDGGTWYPVAASGHFVKKKDGTSSSGGGGW